MEEPTSNGVSGQAETPTISQGDLKAKITTLRDELTRSTVEGYTECVQDKYFVERRTAHNREDDGSDAFGRLPVTFPLPSGKSAGTVLETRYNDGYLSDQGEHIDSTRKGRTWLEGRDADLFTIDAGLPSDTSDGTGFYWEETMSTARPLPFGSYAFTVKEEWSLYDPCDLVLDLEWTVEAQKYGHVLHEALFDPVTSGANVQATATEGVLKPLTFAGGTLNSIGHSGTSVTIGLTPETAYDGKTVEFIGLDGATVLSLEVSAATVDAVNDTLTWSVAIAPWADGDKLMLRVRGDVTQLTTAAPDLKFDATIPQSGQMFKWDAPEDIDGHAPVGYTIQWATSSTGPWNTVQTASRSNTEHVCRSNMEYTACFLRYADTEGVDRGTTYHYRLMVHTLQGDSMPGSSIQKRAR